MLGRAMAFLICCMGVLLPHRLRCLYSSFLGWCTQGVYFAYYGLVNFILRQLREAESKKRSPS